VGEGEASILTCLLVNNFSSQILAEKAKATSHPVVEAVVPKNAVVKDAKSKDNYGADILQVCDDRCTQLCCAHHPYILGTHK